MKEALYKKNDRLKIPKPVIFQEPIIFQEINPKTLTLSKGQPHDQINTILSYFVAHKICNKLKTLYKGPVPKLGATNTLYSSHPHREAQ